MMERKYIRFSPPYYIAQLYDPLIIFVAYWLGWIRDPTKTTFYLITCSVTDEARHRPVARRSGRFLMEDPYNPPFGPTGLAEEIYPPRNVRRRPHSFGLGPDA
jgi:hypothetical protein